MNKQLISAAKPAQGHTPGPWIHDVDAGDNHGYYFITSDNGERHGDVICHVRIDTETGEEEAANARLIAAAPELLTLARAVGEGVLSKYELREQAQAAIAKAEGRAQ